MSKMTAPTSPPAPAGGESRPSLDELRRVLAHTTAAERRLRSRDHATSGELTWAQLRSLAALGREREMTAGQLARSADLKPATVTAMLDHLEAAGVVQRHRSTEDRRVCNVSLTPTGRAVIEGKFARWRAMWDERMADVSDEEIATTVRVLEKVAALYEGIAESHPAPETV